MKTIASLAGAEFLRAANNIRHIAADLFHDTGVLEIRKNTPVFTGSETDAERQAMILEQGRKNISDMFDRLLDEYPERTYALLRACIIDEKEPDGMDLMITATEIMSSKKVLDFLSSVARLVQTNTHG